MEPTSQWFKKSHWFLNHTILHLFLRLLATFAEIFRIEKTVPI